MQQCNATAMTALRSFDVAGKIVFVLWRHGQRRNGTMPTMRAAMLCLLLQGSAWIPRARSPSRIERSRTRLPVGLRSLIIENCRSVAHYLVIFYRSTHPTESISSLCLSVCLLHFMLLFSTDQPIRPVPSHASVCLSVCYTLCCYFLQINPSDRFHLIPLSVCLSVTLYVVIFYR